MFSSEAERQELQDEYNAQFDRYLGWEDPDYCLDYTFDDPEEDHWDMVLADPRA